MATDRLHQILFGGGVEPAGVHHGRLPPAETDAAVETVSGDSGHVAHQRLAPPHQPVEQGGLAHVGPPHDHDDRPQHHRRGIVPTSAFTSAVGVGSTATTGTPSWASRSAGVRSSRKTPAESLSATAGIRTRSPSGTWESCFRMSCPVKRPVTPMLPPKNSLAMGLTVTLSPSTVTFSKSTSRRGANISPVTTLTAPAAATPPGRRGGGGGEPARTRR